MLHIRDCSRRRNHEQGGEGEIAPKRNIEDPIRVLMILPLQGNRQRPGQCSIKPGGDEGHVGSHHGSERNQPVGSRAQIPDQKRHIPRAYYHGQPEFADVGNQVEGKAPGSRRGDRLDRCCCGTHQKTLIAPGRRIHLLVVFGLALSTRATRPLFSGSQR